MTRFGLLDLFLLRLPQTSLFLSSIIGRAFRIRLRPPFSLFFDFFFVFFFIFFFFLSGTPGFSLVFTDLVVWRFL